ncbi:PAS domain-containing sensor histidine kinase [Cupriavidus basilensis]|uniref:histidine kinase n=1 Tax=Cupriavidus basilensis TaxID=68895 RepID=A0A643G275_9BURK|nr:PAS domain-containing sensor histidine kinase [Cupriavidus basilensis]QOT80456.1 PAS domain-containing protein [Cupriavidus basilensis]
MRRPYHPRHSLRKGSLGNARARRRGLHESEASLAEGQRISKTGSWQWWPARREMRWSAEMYRLFGLDPAPGAPGMHTLVAMIHAGERARVLAGMARACKEGTPFQQEFRILCHNGEEKHLICVGQPRRGSEHSLGFVGTVVDITERRRAEEVLRVAQAELAHVSRVAVLGELTASIAHEVSQPLAGIITNGEACLRWLDRAQPNLEEARSAVQRMISEGRRASAVIGRTRALAAKGVPQRAPVDLGAALAESLALLMPEMGNQGVAVSAHVVPGLPAVLGDRIQLQQVLINLLLNAMQACAAVPAGLRSILVRCERLCAAPPRVLCTVQDTGPGIAPANIPNLFDAFFTTRPEGLGMGLSICRSVVESHGGRIWVDEQPGPGATFRFTLPVRETRL